MLKKINKKIRQRGGFALLFSVLVSSLLLTIGLSIFSIALKELSISTAARQSVHAFYAADSGVDCVRYWDKVFQRIPNHNDLTAVKSRIRCGSFDGNSYFSDKLPIPSPTDIITTIIPGRMDADLVIVDSIGSPQGPNYRVEVSKQKDGLITQTMITSDGFDSVGSDRVNRRIIVNY